MGMRSTRIKLAHLERVELHLFLSWTRWAALPQSEVAAASTSRFYESPLSLKVRVSDRPTGDVDGDQPALLPRLLSEQEPVVKHSGREREIGSDWSQPGASPIKRKPVESESIFPEKPATDEHWPQGTTFGWDCRLSTGIEVPQNELFVMGGLI